MNSLSTKQRLFGTIGLLIAVLMLVGFMGFRVARELNDALAYNYDNYFRSQSWLSEVMARQREVQQEILGAVVEHNATAVNAAIANVADHRRRVAELLELYDATECTKEELLLAQEFKEARSRLVAINERVLPLLSQGDFEGATRVIQQESMPANEAALKAGDRLLAYLAQRAGELKEQSDAMFSKDTTRMEVLIALATLGAIALGWLLTRSIVQALGAAQTVASRIANGELGQQIRIDRTDEFGELLSSLKAMDTKLVEIVGQVHASAAQVGAAAGQLAQGNDELSTRTQEQAAALEETASSMEEMTATVKQNADNAQHANQLAASARGQANEGGEIVARAVQAMGEINDASRKIADIIGVIDEIAFQTNLLALNAAVEAARAGEQGRGFAVVATEVRTLAQRSAVAAKEIKELIGDSVQKVKTGSELVDQSGNALRTIVDSIKKVTDIVHEISAASQEQASGIDQVNHAVTQMDTTTQQNAALVEEAAAASKAMQTQAEVLVQQVDFFRINAQHASPVMSRAPVPTSVQPNVVTLTRAKKPSTIPRVSELKPTLARASVDDSQWQEF